MSLLMDALRKAEEAKRQADDSPAPPALDEATGELILAQRNEPTSAAPPSDFSPQIAAHGAELPASARGILETAERAAAQSSTARNAFSAQTPPRSRRVPWLALALGALAASGIGAYFWWQLQAVSGRSRPVPALLPAVQTPTPSPDSAPALLPAPVAVTPPSAAPSAAPTARAAPNAAPETSALFTPRARPSRSAPAAESTAGALRLSRSAPGAAPTIERAYGGLQAGRLDEAQRDYEQVLRGDAKNTDALLGLATIAAHRGQNELAQDYYLRALESDPNDATAQAGLSNTRGQADPGLAESRLKSALAGQPESSALHFALGNLYARQSRWSEAQQAYFHAYSGEPDNADIVFNLAVSLDHLHQNKLAAQYYQMALDRPGMQHGSFDKNQVRQRILELQP